MAADDRTADTDAPDLGETWAHVQAMLPDGWSIDSLRCASTGLSPDERSDD